MTDAPPAGGQDQPLPAHGQPAEPVFAPPSGAPPGDAPVGLPSYPSAPAGFGQPGYGQPGYGQPGGWASPVVAPGGIPLRPLGVGEIISGAFTLVRKNPAGTLGLIGLGDVIGIAIIVLAAVLAAVSRSAALVWFADALWLLLSRAVLSGLIAAQGRAYLGQKVRIIEAVRRSRLGWFLLVDLMYLVMIAAVWVVPVLLLRAWGILAALVLGAWLGISFCLAYPVVVLEQVNPLAAMARSWQLVKGSFWRIFGIFALLAVVVGVVFFMFSLVLDLIAALFLGSAFTPHASHANAVGVLIFAIVAVLVIELFVGGLIAVLGTGILVLIYADLRMRKEGFDLVLQQSGRGQRLTGDEFALTGIIGAPAGPPGGYPGGGQASPGAWYPGAPPAS